LSCDFLSRFSNEFSLPLVQVILAFFLHPICLKVCTRGWGESVCVCERERERERERVDERVF
jgi:hypothetical protein